MSLVCGTLLATIYYSIAVRLDTPMSLRSLSPSLGGGKYDTTFTILPRLLCISFAPSFVYTANVWITLTIRSQSYTRSAYPPSLLTYISKPSDDRLGCNDAHHCFTFVVSSNLVFSLLFCSQLWRPSLLLCCRYSVTIAIIPVLSAAFASRRMISVVATCTAAPAQHDRL